MQGGNIIGMEAPEKMTSQTMFDHLWLPSSPERIFDAITFAAGVAVVPKLFIFLENAFRKRRLFLEEARSAFSPSNLKFRFLAVFWAARFADWLQGPFFYGLFAQKTFNDVSASPGLIAKLFLVGFLSAGVLGPPMGKIVDCFIGRKVGMMVCLLASAASVVLTLSNSLPTVFLGRILAGLGTALLYSVPESWLASEAQKLRVSQPLVCSNETSVNEILGVAYGGDALLGVAAGQVGARVSSYQGSPGPYLVSGGVSLLGCLLTSLLWNESTATGPTQAAEGKGTGTSLASFLYEVALSLHRDNRKAMLLGLSQAAFESAMFIFVLQWSPALTAAFQSYRGHHGLSKDLPVPFGKAFSCFMLFCYLGSQLFRIQQSQLRRRRSSAELPPLQLIRSQQIMFLVATVALWLASGFTSNIFALLASFFVYEVCVGFYFPAMGSLRNNIVPADRKTTWISSFNFLMNAIVVSVFLSSERLGVVGSLRAAASIMAVGSVALVSMHASADDD